MTTNVTIQLVQVADLGADFDIGVREADKISLSPPALAAALAALPAATLAPLASALVPVWLDALPVYSGSGAAPVATGQWFLNNGVPTRAN